MKHIVLACSLMAVAFTVQSQDSLRTVTISEDLQVTQLSPHSWMHVSWTAVEPYGRFTNNGLIYINNGEAVIMDTPPDEPLSRLLLDWFNKTFPGITIKAVVATHFHNDCLGGLKVFHEAGFPSYSNYRTLALITADSVVRPQHSFWNKMLLKVGNEKVVCRYFGEAHTEDNIVAYVPAEKILFGGCMIKSLNSGKGNLSDANVEEWSGTVKKVKKVYGKARIVIPGHGAAGDTRLLDYTIEMFAQ